MSLLFICIPALGQWQDVEVSHKISGNNSYFNATITEIGEGYNILSHTNPLCEYKLTSPCRKGQIAFWRDVRNENKIRKYSFDYEINRMNITPQWVIIFQDWVRIHADDANGNRPITTVKIRRFEGRLFLQHWDNSWQWEHDPSDYDTQLTVGRETMNGEIEVFRNNPFHIEMVVHDSGHAKLYVDGVKISDRKYKTTHLTEKHTVMMGMYWSKGFNIEHDSYQQIDIDISNIKYQEVNF